MKVPARVWTSALLVFLIGLPVIGVEAQSGVSFTVVSGPIVSNSLLSRFSLQVFPQTPLGHFRVGPLAYRSPYPEFGYGIYSGPRDNHPPRYFGPRHSPCLGYTWDPYWGLFDDWLWGCDVFAGLAYRSTHHFWNRFLARRHFRSRLPRHAFTYWRDPFIPPWGPHWTQDPWAPFWDGYWGEPGFGGHFPASSPGVPAIAEPKVPSRTATPRPSSRVGSPSGYGEGSARTPGRSAGPRNSNPPSRWPKIPVLDSEDPEAPKAKPRSTRTGSAPPDFIRPPSAHPSPDPQKGGEAKRGTSTRNPRPSDQIRKDGAVTQKSPRSRNRSPYDRGPVGGVSDKATFGKGSPPKVRTRDKASPLIPQTKPAPNRGTKVAPSPSGAPKPQAKPRANPKPPPLPISTVRRARRPGS